MSLEFLKTGDDDFRQVASLVTIGNLDGFIELAFAQRAGDGRSKLPRLLAGSAVRHEPVDHDADRIGGHDEQTDHNATSQGAHLEPKVDGIPLNRGLLLVANETPIEDANA